MTRSPRLFPQPQGAKSALFARTRQKHDKTHVPIPHATTQQTKECSCRGTHRTNNQRQIWAQGRPDDHCAGDHGVGVQPDDDRADNVHGADEQHVDRVATEQLPSTRPRRQEWLESGRHNSVRNDGSLPEQALRATERRLVLTSMLASGFIFGNSVGFSAVDAWPHPAGDDARARARERRNRQHVGTQ